MDHLEYKTSSKGATNDTVKLVLLGGARHKDDLARVESLRALAKELGIEVSPKWRKAVHDHSPLYQKQVSFVVNAPYPEMISWLSRSSIGLSTMIDEHFGINVVEFMVRSPFT